MRVGADEMEKQGHAQTLSEGWDARQWTFTLQCDLSAVDRLATRDLSCVHDARTTAMPRQPADTEPRSAERAHDTQRADHDLQARFGSAQPNGASPGPAGPP